MKTIGWTMFSLLVLCILTLSFALVPQPVNASQTWHLQLGAASRDQAKQAMAFLPNEVWIYAGDSVTWTSQTQEGHTLTFLMPLQVRPNFFTGCAGGAPPFGSTPTGGNFTGAACVNSGPFVNGPPSNNYTVTFPNAGNFKFVCLIHNDMTGVVHVLSHPEALPHNQAFYDDQAAQQAKDMLADSDRITDDEHTNNSTRFANSKNSVITTGELVATGGGKAYLAIMRFLPETIRVHVGDTVEWTNMHPSEPHTVTFGIEPPNPFFPVGATQDSDGAAHGKLPNPATTNSFNSSLYGPSAQEITGLPQMPISLTRVRVTFTQPGTYNYICALHDELGMKGTVIVEH
jgi:plastocyanin